VPVVVGECVEAAAPAECLAADEMTCLDPSCSGPESLWRFHGDFLTMACANPRGASVRARTAGVSRRIASPEELWPIGFLEIS
jgi:hypothetical protein